MYNTFYAFSLLLRSCNKENRSSEENMQEIKRIRSELRISVSLLSRQWNQTKTEKSIVKSFPTWGVAVEGDSVGRLTPWLPLKTSLHKMMSRIKIYGRFQQELKTQPIKKTVRMKIGFQPQTHKDRNNSNWKKLKKKKIHWFHSLGSNEVTTEH